MIYKFETEDKETALGALIIYAIYRSRNKDRFKVTPKMWGQITAFSKSSAKKSRNLPQFIERLRKQMKTEYIIPNFCRTTTDDHKDFAKEEDKQFLTSILERCDEKKVLQKIYKQTAFIVALVQERIENEKEEK